MEEGAEKDFKRFMNLLIYLVYGRDKSFDMQSLKAFKSLKAYKFFYNGFLKNVWVYECPTAPIVMQLQLCLESLVSCLRSPQPHLRVPLEQFVSVNGDNGDVYSVKCNCVSG